MEYSLICESRSGHNFIRNIVNSWFPTKNKYNNIESCTINEYYRGGKYLIKTVNNPDHNIIVIREPLNWLSSFIRQLETGKPRDIKSESQIRIDKYIDILEEGVGIKNRLPKKTLINYDRFVFDQKYRMEICESIGGTYSESYLNIVPQNGRYSSFDGAKFQHKGSQMEVTKRYTYYEKHKTQCSNIYFSLIKENPRIIEISKKYFGEDENIISFLKRNGIFQL